MKHWLVLPFLASSLFAATMSHEEAAVRATYAKLSYAGQIRSLHKTVDDYDNAKVAPEQINHAEAFQRVAQEDVTFTLSDFSIGNIADLKVNYEDLVTKPDGNDVLAVAPGRFTYTETSGKNESSVANAQWVRGQTVTEDWKIPAAQALSQPLEGSLYSRYAAFRVSVKFQNQVRDYKALFLFGKSSDGNEIVFPLDMVTNQSALWFFTKHDVYPATLVRTHLHAHPLVSEWLRANADANCQSGKTCYNQADGKWRISAQDAR
jgi:hypothetical protein